MDALIEQFLAETKAVVPVPNPAFNPAASSDGDPSDTPSPTPVSGPASARASGRFGVSTVANGSVGITGLVGSDSISGLSQSFNTARAGSGRSVSVEAPSPAS